VYPIGGGADPSRARPSVILRRDLPRATLGRYEGHNNEKMLLPMTPSCSFRDGSWIEGNSDFERPFGQEAWYCRAREQSNVRVLGLESSGIFGAFLDRDADYFQKQIAALAVRIAKENRDRGGKKRLDNIGRTPYSNPEPRPVEGSREGRGPKRYRRRWTGGCGLWGLAACAGGADSCQTIC
jgi:hypothetical protein